MQQTFLRKIHIKTTAFYYSIKNCKLAPLSMSKSTLKINQTADNAPKFQIIEEGSARMEYDSRETVFYNKVQVFNRDISIQVIKLYSEILQAEKLAKSQEKKAKKDKKKATSKGDKSMPMEGDITNAEATNASSSNDAATSSPTAEEPFHGIHILDALAASGLRSIRYLKEIPLARHVTINDISLDAITLAKENCVKNDIPLDRVTLSHEDATMLMYQHRPSPLAGGGPKRGELFDVIDLDPYGTASPFLDAAVQAVSSEGGLLCITCTDMTVLSGSYPEVCYTKYSNSMPLKNTSYVHEMSLRILLHAIDATANKYKRYIVPWLSLSVDFYVRVFVRVYENPTIVKDSCRKRMYVLQCVQCPSFYLQSVGAYNDSKGNYTASVMQPLDSEGHLIQCVHCQQGKLKLGGPYWKEAIHDAKIVDTLLSRMNEYHLTGGGAADTKRSSSSSSSLPAAALFHHPYPIATSKRIAGLLTTIREEVALSGHPLFYSLPALGSAVQCPTPTLQQVTSALGNAGYSLSQFHHEPHALKTDAPLAFLWDMMRTIGIAHHAKEEEHLNKDKSNNSKKKPRKELTPVAKQLLAQPINATIDFSFHHQRMTQKKKRSMESNSSTYAPRFAPNPEEGWGPKRRAQPILQQTAAVATATVAVVANESGKKEGDRTGEEEEVDGKEPVEKKAKKEET